MNTEEAVNERGWEYKKMNESILYASERDAMKEHTDFPLIFLALLVILILVLIAFA